MANYFVIGGDGKEYGPVSEADVRQWIIEGRLNEESRVKGESDAEFRSLAQFPEFAASLRRPGTAPAPSPAAPVFENWEQELMHREPELRLGECLGAGWSFLGANFGFLAVAVVLTWLMHLVLVVVASTVPVVGSLIMDCLEGVVMGGLYLTCLRRMRGEAVSPAGVFAGFQEAFVPLLLTGLVSAVLFGIGCCFLIIPGVYLGVAWVFAVPLVADRKVFFWTGMELSRKVVTPIWFEVFGLLLVALLPMIIAEFYSAYVFGIYGMGLWERSGHDFQQLARMMQSEQGNMRGLGFKVTAVGQVFWLVNLFYFTGVIVRAYENLFGPRKS